MGMSLKSQMPTVLICTSGSAGYNYAPAVAEAYFNRVPLLILTADRPPELIDQRDGQTIYQENLYGNHVKGFYTFPSLDISNDVQLKSHQMIDEAINICLQVPYGPVHVNVPMREPFYPEIGEQISYSNSINITINQLVRSFVLSESLKNILERKKKVLIIAGQANLDSKMSELLDHICDGLSIPIVCDIISNQHSIKTAIKFQDLFLKNRNDESLYPDLIISFGLSVISKNLKLFLRSCKNVEHWHISLESFAPDTFLQLTEHVEADPLSFFEELTSIDLNPIAMKSLLFF